VSKAVPAPHVSIVAVPDAAGVHTNTASGAAAVAISAQLPWSALDPVVTPVITPPAGGTTVGAPHVPAAPASVLDVVELVDVEVVDGAVPIVLDVGSVTVVDDDPTAVEPVVLDVVVLLVDVVVLPPAGGTTVTANAPLEPPHDPAYPSTTMTYVWPATTVGVSSEPW